MLKTIAVVVVAIAGVSVAMPHTLAAEPRTIIDRLEGHNPEEAARVFVGAFEASDYVAAYFLMSPRARRSFTEGVQSFNLGQFFVGLDSAGEIPGSVFSQAVSLDDEDSYATFSEPVLLFDNIMYAAEKGGFLPIRLVNPQIGGAAVSADGVIRVEVSNQGEPKVLTLDLMPTLRGAWLVDAIHWEGSDPTKRPWGVEP